MKPDWNHVRLNALRTLADSVATCGCHYHCVCDAQCDKKESWREPEFDELIQASIAKAQTRLKLIEQFEKLIDY